MKTNYLQAMGIVAWRLREQPALQNSVYCYRLLDAHDHCRGILITKISTTSERELFQAILQALNMKTEQGAWTPASCCIVLGADCAAEYPTGDTQAIITHALADMLFNPRLKAKVWQDLQLFLRQQ